MVLLYLVITIFARVNVKSERENASYLTFKNRAPLYIGRAYHYLPDVTFYIFCSTNISTEYIKHAAHSLFFSSKCRLFHNSTLLVPVLFKFYIQGVLKFKCKTLVPKC